MNLRKWAGPTWIPSRHLKPEQALLVMGKACLADPPEYLLPSMHLNTEQNSLVSANLSLVFIKKKDLWLNIKLRDAERMGRGDFLFRIPLKPHDKICRSYIVSFILCFISAKQRRVLRLGHHSELKKALVIDCLMRKKILPTLNQ
jgi:hypothetical protein